MSEVSLYHTLFRVYGLGVGIVRAWGLGFGVWGLVCKVQGSGFMVWFQGSGFRVRGSAFWVYGLRFLFQCFRWRVDGWS